MSMMLQSHTCRSPLSLLPMFGGLDDAITQSVGIKIPSSSNRIPGSGDSRYPVTILQSSITDAVSVNVNTSHSIETYPEDNKI